MTTILLLLLAYCCSVLFAWRFITMKHWGLICVFSSHDIVSFVGGNIGRVGSGFRANSTSIQSVQSNFFHKLKKFLNKMLLFIHNHFKCVVRSELFFFFSLNLWMCESSKSVNEWSFLNWPYWTGSETLNLLMGGKWCGSGGFIYSECSGVSCSVWGAERIIRLYHSITADWHCRADNRQVVRPCDGS